MRIKVIFSILLMISGCSSSDKLKLTEEKAFYSVQNKRNFIILRPDKSCYIQHQKFFFGSYSCTYRIDNNYLEMSFKDGTAMMFKITNNSLIAGGEIFTDTLPKKF